METQLSLSYLLGVTLELSGGTAGIFRENLANTMVTDALAPSNPSIRQPWNWLYTFNSLRPGDAYMRRQSNHHWFR